VGILLTPPNRKGKQKGPDFASGPFCCFQSSGSLKPDRRHRPVHDHRPDHLGDDDDGDDCCYWLRPPLDEQRLLPLLPAPVRLRRG
jgi:hypothetical protein